MKSMQYRFARTRRWTTWRHCGLRWWKHHCALDVPAPHLTVIQSPYRRLVGPLLEYITKIKDEYPDRQIAVIIPDLVERHWYHYLLHNQEGEVLKALLLLRGDERLVIIGVPW